MVITTAVKSFIEEQFPVSKLSKESYKERKSNNSQTLTGLGKWWGRKPLILVRAVLLGLLLPSTNNPKKDRDIFLKILTMDEDGLWERKTKAIPIDEIYERLDIHEQDRWFDVDTSRGKIRYKKSVTAVEKKELQKTVFNLFSYDEKLEFCERPENSNGPSLSAWEAINEHLGTNVFSLSDLTAYLGYQRFGHTPRVGDAFCGGGSIPFEAARIGCEVFASDLNPIASLLTWSSLNIIGGGIEVEEGVREIQKRVYDAVDRKIVSWGIEHNEQGWRADAYLFCTETNCPECGWKVPLSPSWIIGENTHTVAQLQPDLVNHQFKIVIKTGVSQSEIIEAKTQATIKKSSLVCPNLACQKSTPITSIRGDRKSDIKTKYGLRMWEKDDILPRLGDTFQERLYCIRWIETYQDGDGEIRTIRHYRRPTDQDFYREEKVVNLLLERFDDWQNNGYIPVLQILSGDKTEELIRTRGWTYWHHLYTPRALLTHGEILSHVLNEGNISLTAKISLLLGLGRCADYNSKLSAWDPSAGNERVAHTFSNQALNTLYNFGSKSLVSLASSWFLNFSSIDLTETYTVEVADARKISSVCDIWLTDPPYADAVNYHELSEFFLCWFDKLLDRLFPTWYTDSKRALAIAGSTEVFRKSMVECYRNLASHMSDEGLQVVMFTHQDTRVWADLALILWASGLRVTSAWCIGTETSSAYKVGNYVQGTVLLVLRKQTSEDIAFLDEIHPQVEKEVKAQLDAMITLDDKDDPNFSDTDYQLASYAAALRVLTQYKNIEDIDIAYELSKERSKGDISPVEKIIADAVKVSCDYLVPQGFDVYIWKTLAPEERFYLKGLDLESHSEYRTGAYQELARGFGVKEYKYLLSSSVANQARLKTSLEFNNRYLGDAGFGSSLVRNALFAIREVIKTEDVQKGKNWLKNEIQDYWNQRKSLMEILFYISKMDLSQERWKLDAQTASLVMGALKNDHA